MNGHGFRIGFARERRRSMSARGPSSDGIAPQPGVVSSRSGSVSRAAVGADAATPTGGRLRVGRNGSRRGDEVTSESGVRSSGEAPKTRKLQLLPGLRLRKFRHPEKYARPSAEPAGPGRKGTVYSGTPQRSLKNKPSPGQDQVRPAPKFRKDCPEVLQITGFINQNAM